MRLVATQGLEWEISAAKSHEGSIWGDANIPGLDCDDGNMGSDISQN